MKRRRLLAALLTAFLAVLPAVPARPAHAATAFSFRSVSRSVSAGGTVQLEVGIGAGTGIAAFRLRVSYDPSVLRLSGVSASPQMEPGTLQTNGESDPVCSVYVCGVGKGQAAPLSGTVVTYLFQALQGVSAGTTDVCACVDETCGFSGNDLCLDTYDTIALNVLPAASGEAVLTALRPSWGELEPDFSPDVVSYRLRVGSYVSSVAFQADASEGAGMVISRKSLFAAGSETPITITVTSADKKNRTVYLVTVSRAAEEPESAAFRGEKQPSEAKTGKADPTSQKPPGKLPGRRVASSGNRADSAAEFAFAAAKAGKKASAPTPEAAGVAPPVYAQPAPPVSAQPAVSPPLTIVQSRMPSYLVGMLAAGFCIVTGILLSLWFGAKKK